MIGRTRQLALVLTAILVAAAACANRERQESARNRAPAPATTHGFTLVASGGDLPQVSVADRAADGGGCDFRPMLFGAAFVEREADLAPCHTNAAVHGTDSDRPGAPSVHPPPRTAQSPGAEPAGVLRGGAAEDGLVKGE